MSGLFGHLVGVFILALMLVFLGIWYWAWRPRHKPTFDALARLPLLEEDGAFDECCAPRKHGAPGEDGAPGKDEALGKHGALETADRSAEIATANESRARRRPS